MQVVTVGKYQLQGITVDDDRLNRAVVDVNSLDEPIPKRGKRRRKEVENGGGGRRWRKEVVPAKGGGGMRREATPKIRVLIIP